MRVALVHDQLNQLGGAERVLVAFRELFPDAPIFTLLARPGVSATLVPGADVRVSALQRVPLAGRNHRVLLPLFPLFTERLDLRGYDLVLSSSAAWSKGVRKPPGALHVCYCHSPMRFAWDLEHVYVPAQPWWARPALPLVMRRLRAWDVATAARVDAFIANSHHVAERIRRCYGRPSTVIWPPVDVDRFTPGGGAGDYFLVVSRLVPYKCVDIAVEACTRLGLRLVVVGDGPERERLSRLAGPRVGFAGEVTDDELRDLYRGCRALLFPGIEDFGIAPVEAQACGRPVIAFGRGGALETVVPGVTGELVRDQTPEAFADGLAAFDPGRYDPSACRANAARFDRARFLDGISTFVTSALSAHQAGWRTEGVLDGTATLAG